MTLIAVVMNSMIYATFRILKTAEKFDVKGSFRPNSLLMKEWLEENAMMIQLTQKHPIKQSSYHLTGGKNASFEMQWRIQWPPLSFPFSCLIFLPFLSCWIILLGVRPGAANAPLHTWLTSWTPGVYVCGSLPTHPTHWHTLGPQGHRQAAAAAAA